MATLARDMSEQRILQPSPGSRPGLLNLSPAAQLRAGRLPRRLTQLFIGLTLYGLSTALLIRSGLGMQPWTVLGYGIAEHVPLSIGTIVILIALAVLLAWIPLRQLPGLGTLANATWIGVAIDLALGVLSQPTNIFWQITFMIGAVFLNGVATAMYIGSQLGPGPRDGLMTGLVRVTGRSIRLVRTSIEVTVVSVGWLLGGVVGIGTLLYALAIGPLTQLLLPYLTVRLDATAAKTVPAAGRTDSR